MLSADTAPREGIIGLSALRMMAFQDFTLYWRILEGPDHHSDGHQSSSSVRDGWVGSTRLLKAQ